jgi:hypothetical protein
MFTTDVPSHRFGARDRRCPTHAVLINAGGDPVLIVKKSKEMCALFATSNDDRENFISK